MTAYKALVDLWYPTDTQIIRDLAAGKQIPVRVRGMKHVVAGSIVSDIPAVSVSGLLAKGRIEAVESEVPDGEAR